MAKAIPSIFDKLAEKKGGATVATDAKSAPGAKGATIATDAPSATFVRRGVYIRDEYHRRLKDIAYWERRSLKDVLDEALSTYLAGHKRKEE